MAHQVAGVDLGAWSVKFVVIESGFRRTRIVATHEERVPDGVEALPERQAKALRAGLTLIGGEPTTYLALPGDKVAIRLLELPFSEARKIEQVIGYELEGQVIHALQDVVYDHVTLAGPGPGSLVLAAAARTDDVAAFLAVARSGGADARGLFAAPVAYHTLAVQRPGEEGTLPSCCLLLDVGDRTTNICVLANGATVFARTMLRGGGALTAAVGRAAGVETQQAAALKHAHGFVASAQLPATTATEQQMDAVLRAALEPMLRELRQTLASHRARSKTPIESIVLTGGGARVRGLPEYLTEALELPTAGWGPDLGAGGEQPDHAAAGEVTGQQALPNWSAPFALAAGVAWAGARGGKEIDLRRGPFVYRANLSVVRQKAMHIGALAAALVIALSIDGAMALMRLTRQKEALTAELKSATQELFGAARRDTKQVATELKKSFRDEMAPIPRATAFDLLGQISRKMPSAEKIKLDIQQLEIKPKKTFIKGTVDSVAAVDEIVAKLKEIDCFSDITKGSIVEVAGAGKQFSLTIGSKCP